MKNTYGNSARSLPRASSARDTSVCRPAEEAYKKGLRALKASEILVARALFEAAIQIERRSGAARVQPRYLSYYGLTLMDDPGRRAMALECCVGAAREEFFNPDLFLNLSVVYLRLGNRAEAHAAAMRGLALDPQHPGLLAHVSAMGVRARPPIPFLDRANFLNVALGRVLRRGARASDRR